MRAPNETVAVNPIMCRAYGMCAEILPERITLDDWGYPMIDGTPLSPELVELARHAVESCPTNALRIAAGSPPSAR